MPHASRAAAGVNEQTLSEIFSRSRVLNAEVGITGMLILRQGFFLQLLEGPESAVRNCYRRIIRDPRHTDATLVLQSNTDHRIFPVWSMASVCHDASRSCFDNEFLPILDDLKNNPGDSDRRNASIRKALATFRQGLRTSA